MLVFNWVVGIAIIAATAWLTDRAPLTLLRLALLYLVAIAAPSWWYYRARRYFRANNLVETPELHAIAFRPILVGVLTLMMALPFILGRR